MSKEVEIRSNDRVAVMGKTGSGKTVTTKKLLWEPLDRVIFYDWKQEEADDLDAPILRSLDEVREALFAEREEERIYKFAYVPADDELGIEPFDRLAQLVYEKGDMHLIADEIKGVYQQGGSVLPISDHHEKILTRGRSRGVGMTNLSQRPKKIPLEVLSEAEHVFAFRLNLSADRDRIEEVVGDGWDDTISDLTTGEFLYYYEGWDEPIVSDPIEI